jgi:hypothetical protein
MGMLQQRVDVLEARAAEDAEPVDELERGDLTSTR